MRHCKEGSRQQPDLWQALADPTRRALIDLLATGAKSTSALCEGFAMTRFGVMKHLGVLEAAGLVIARKHGRVRLNHLNAAPLVALQARWLSPRAKASAEGILGFARSLEETDMTNDSARSSAGVVDVALEWEIVAPVQRVWAALFDAPEQWWPAEHRAVGGDAKMRFAAELGARLTEAAANGSELSWYSVYAIDPMRTVDMAGNLATRYGGPATSLLHIELAQGQVVGTTILKLTDSVFGRVGDGLRASLTDGWQAIIGGGLVAYCAAA